MRVQYTLKEATVTAIRQRAEALDIHPSRLVEEYLTAALRSNAAVTLTQQSAVTSRAVTHPPGSKETLYQPKLGEPTTEDIFGPAPVPRKPLGEVTDDELDALDERGAARAPLASS